MEFDILANLEGPNRSVFGNFPGLCQLRHKGIRLDVIIEDQGFVNILQNLTAGSIVARGRI